MEHQDTRTDWTFSTGAAKAILYQQTGYNIP